MLKRIISGAIASTFSAALLAGCGGGGGSSAVPSSPGKTGGTAAIKFTIKFPGRNGVSVHGKRLPLYVSRSTAGIGVDFAATPGGLGTTPNGTPNYAQKIAVNDAAAPGCDAVAQSDGSFNCTIYIPGVPAGYNDFAVTLWNGAPITCGGGGGYGTGCSFSGDYALSTNVIVSDVTLAGTTTTLPALTLNPVVDSVYVQMGGGFVDGTSNSVNGLVVFKDAAGNIIAGGDQLVDASGNPLTVTLGVANDQGTTCTNDFDTAPQCSIYFVTGTGADPKYQHASDNSGTFTLNYDGVFQFPSSGLSQPAVQINGVGAINGLHNNTSVSITQTNGQVGVPGVPQVSVLNSAFSPSAGQNTMTLGSDGNLWMVRNNGDIDAVTPGGVSFDFAGAQGLTGSAGQLTAGSEGYIWYTDTTNRAIGRFAPIANGSNISVTESSPIPGATFGGIAQGPAGNIWFSDTTNNSLDTIDPNVFTAPTVNPIQGGATPGAVAAGPVFNFSSVCTIVTGPQVNCYKLSGTWNDVVPAATPVSIITGPDNKLYVGETGKIEVFTVSGAGFAGGSTVYNLATAGAQVQSMAVGHDGNIWFIETGGANPTFGDLTIQASTPKVNEYSANTAIPAGTVPSQIVLGPSPNFLLYLTDSSGTNSVDSIAP